MALGIGIPTNKPTVEILNFISNLQVILNKIIINDNLNFYLDKISSNNMIGKNLLIKNGTKVIFEKYDTEVTIFYDDMESSFDYKGQGYQANWFSIDVTGFRNPLGYLMVAAISIMISEKALGFIEDSACFWVSEEILEVKDFISQISLLESTSNIEELCCQGFYKNLHGN